MHWLSHSLCRSHVQMGFTRYSAFRVSQSWNQGDSQPGFLSGGSGGEFASRLMQVVGRIQLLLLQLGTSVPESLVVLSLGGARFLETTHSSRARFTYGKAFVRLCRMCPCWTSGPVTASCSSLFFSLLPLPLLRPLFFLKCFSIPPPTAKLLPIL